MTKEPEQDMHTPSKMSERILDVIEKKKLAPKPKWHFFLKEWFVWGMVFVALCVGSIATALTMYIANASRFIERQIIFSDIFFLFKLIPLVWLSLFGVAIFYTVYALRETRRGYRWSPAWLVGASLALSIILGSSVYASGISEAIDRYLLTEMPIYKPLTNFEPKMWMNTELGVVAGVVTDVEEETFTIQQIDGELLEVLPSPLCTETMLEELHEGMHVRLVGTTTQQGGQALFEISEVQTFYGRGGMMRGNTNSPLPKREYLKMKEN